MVLPDSDEPGESERDALVRVNDANRRQMSRGDRKVGAFHLGKYFLEMFKNFRKII